jgi:hypothetical protein
MQRNDKTNNEIKKKTLKNSYQLWLTWLTYYPKHEIKIIQQI